MARMSNATPVLRPLGQDDETQEEIITRQARLFMKAIIAPVIPTHLCAANVVCGVRGQLALGRAGRAGPNQPRNLPSLDSCSGTHPHPTAARNLTDSHSLVHVHTSACTRAHIGTH